MLRQLEVDISGVTIDGKDVPVKLRVHQSLFVPMAKWSMLLTGNYRCVTKDNVIPIKQAVHSNLEESRSIYQWVDKLAGTLGANPEDQVPFEKYAKAAESLMKPSSAARAIASGTSSIERVDLLVQTVALQLGMSLEAVDNTVEIVSSRLIQNQR